jgi:hypothetical protein
VQLPPIPQLIPSHISTQSFSILTYPVPHSVSETVSLMMMTAAMIPPIKPFEDLKAI